MHFLTHFLRGHDKRVRIGHAGQFGAQVVLAQLGAHRAQRALQLGEARRLALVNLEALGLRERRGDASAHARSQAIGQRKDCSLVDAQPRSLV